MPDQSTSQSSTGPRESQVPAIRSFEFDARSIGDIKSSVNQFRGSIALPIDLLTLEGRPGLDVKVSILYESNVQRQVETWNVDAPTGILGMGWQMPFDFITRDENGNGSPTSDSFFLVSSGSASPLVKTGERGDLEVYQLRNFQFWDIVYDPRAESWRVTKEDGSVSVFGGGGAGGGGGGGGDSEDGAVQYGVRWGNWLGSSSRLDGQETYAVSWNLASITSVLGHRVSYSYDAVRFAVGGSGGKEFTQASYVRRIVDSLGRRVTFRYKEKFGARNPSNRGIVEYQAEHAGRPEPNAYQDRYQTRYLDTVEVHNAQDELLYGLQMTYDFLNLSTTTDPQRDLLWKRVLTSVFQWGPDEQVLPGLEFTYADSPDDVHPGALTNIVYPSGGEATFAYKKNLLAQPRTLTVDNPLPGSKPGVWHGNDYVVFTFASSRGMRVRVLSWNGRWVSEDITPSGVASRAVDPDTVWVAPMADSLALAVRDPGGSQDLVYLFRKDVTGFGQWQLDPAGERRLPLAGSDPGPSQFAAGADFVLAANADYPGAAFQGFSWDWRDGRWNPPSILPSSSEARAATGFQMAAVGNYYAVAFYTAGSRQVRFETFYREATGAWAAGAPWTNSDLDVVEEDGRLLWTLAPQPGYMALTHVTGTDADSIHYAVRIAQLDERFGAIDPSSPRVVNLTSPIVDGASRFEIFRTFAVGNFVANNPANLRNEGGQQQGRAAANWLQRDFPLDASSAVDFAAGDDVAVATQDPGKNQIVVFDPNQPAQSAWSFPTNVDQQGTVPTAGGRYLSIGRSLYFRQADGTWSLLGTQLDNLTDEPSVRNRAPRYLAYQDRDDTSARSYLVSLANGGGAAPVELPGGPQKMAVPRSEARAGAELAGPRFLVTYPSAQEFDQASSLTLYNVDDGELSEVTTDLPVAWLEISNPFDPATSFVQSYFYTDSEQSQVAYDTATGIAQYPRVVTVPALRSTASSPPSGQPQGRSEFFYSNGLSPQNDLRYPVGTIVNYQSILNGSLLAQRDFDADGRLVGEQINVWEVSTAGPDGEALWGAWARPVKSTVTRDGVTVESTSGFDPSSGLVSWRQQVYTDADGKRKRLRDETTYAFQVPDYASLFTSLHYLNAEAQRSKSVVDAATGAVTYVESTATTWKDWSDGGREISAAAGATGRPARWQAYRWRAESDTPDFPFSGGDRSDWVLLQEVTARTEPDYLIAEQSDVRGVSSSFVYDAARRYLVASFPGGSAAGEEVSYWGAETYEDDGGWTLGSGASVVPEAPGGTGGAVDAHTGERAVSLAAGATGDAGIHQTFRPARAGSYGFSAWVKLPAGFSPGAGAARFTVTVGSGSPVSVDFPATTGEWAHLAARFEVATAGQTVTIRGENANSRSAVLVDDLTFAPWDCTWSAVAYDTRLWLPAARVETNGATTRTVYDTFGRTVLTTGAADRLSEITEPYQSREGNGGTFSTADPDRTTVLRPATDGFLTTFRRGDEWRSRWTPSPADGWRVEDGRLTQTSAGSAGALKLGGVTAGEGYVLSTRFTPTEAVDQPLGVRIGDRLTLSWSPQTGRWSLTDGAGAPVAAPAIGDGDGGGGDTLEPSVLLRSTVANDDDGATRTELAPGPVSDELRELFAAAGRHLSADAHLSPADGADHWDLAVPGATHRYQVRPGDDGALEVTRVGGAWSLLVRGRTLLFWVDGKTVFSYQASSELTGAPELFFGSRVALSSLASGADPAAAASYTDASGNPLQEQGLEVERMTVRQVLTDELGRTAVSTKPAWVNASGTTPLLQYVADFAHLDWSTGVMTGLVAQAFPADGGYPYTRDTYERSPLGRVVERGLPGTELRVGAHSTRFAYGPDDGSLGLPAGKYTRESVTDPDGHLSHRVLSTLGQVVAQVTERSASEGGDVITFRRFDDAGNPVSQRLPNYYTPPTGSTPDDWVVHQSFDFDGRLLSTRTGSDGATEMVYSAAGQLRFLRDPQGAEDGTYNFWKYDRLGRLVETGFVTGSWNRQTLQRQADGEPDAPAAPGTWRRRLEWDGATPAERSVGLVARTAANNADGGVEDVVETFVYDVYGNTTQAGQTVTGHGAERRVDYAFDDAGDLLRVTYPEDAAAVDGASPRWSVQYRYDPLRRVDAVADDGDFASPLATWAYFADGRPETETLTPGGGATVTRELTYNSPLWPRTARDRQAGDLLFGEELTYETGGYDGAGYFGGDIASTTYATGGGVDGYAFRYAYGTVGEVTHGESPEQPSWNLGVSSSVLYDANGNLVSVPRGGENRRYDYQPGTQRVVKVVGPSGGAELASYDYDANGAVVRSSTAASPSSPARDLAFTYDPGFHRAVRVETGSGSTVLLTYGGAGQRVVKESRQGERTVGSTLYVRGTHDLPLYESRSTDAGSVESFYVYGPAGLLALRRDGAVYGLLKDHLGSVRRVVDSTGTVVASYDYLTFGTVARQSEPEDGFLTYLFTGQEWDAELGLYNYRARFYGAELGRFLDVDTARQFASPYLYAANNPVLYVDPSGRFSLKSLFSAIGGLIIGAVQILIGVVIDVVAGVLAVVTGGLSTPASVALASLAGVFYGAGTSAILYSVINVQSFDWKEYGIQMGIGAVAGAISFGFGALGSAAAEGATGVKAAVEAGQSVSRLARATSAGIEAGANAVGGFVAGVASVGINDAAHNVNPGFDVIEGGLWSALSGGLNRFNPIPGATGDTLGKRVLSNVAFQEVKGVSLTVSRNLIDGKPAGTDLVSSVVAGGIGGATGGLQAQNATTKTLKEMDAAYSSIQF